MRRGFYFVVAWISLALGIIGIVLPVLPTTPFLILTVICFSKSSKRFEEWFAKTKLYQIYVADYLETKSIDRSRKKKIIIYLHFNGGFYLFCSNYFCKNWISFINGIYYVLSI